MGFLVRYSGGKRPTGSERSRFYEMKEGSKKHKGIDKDNWGKSNKKKINSHGHCQPPSEIQGNLKKQNIPEKKELDIRITQTYSQGKKGRQQ